MRPGNSALALGVVAVLVAGSGTWVAQPAGAAAEAAPAYSLEGAWYGTVTVGGQPTLSLDTFASNAQRPGVEGTMLCTIHPWQMPGPGGVVLSFTPAGHGNWVRIAKNTYAFTVMRSIVDQNLAPVGWARFRGTVAAVSEDEYSGTMEIQFFLLDGTPFSQVFTGALASRRIPIPLENQP